MRDVTITLLLRPSSVPAAFATRRRVPWIISNPAAAGAGGCGKRRATAIWARARDAGCIAGRRPRRSQSVRRYLRRGGSRPTLTVVGQVVRRPQNATPPRENVIAWGVQVRPRGGEGAPGRIRRRSIDARSGDAASDGRCRGSTMCYGPKGPARDRPQPPRHRSPRVREGAKLARARPASKAGLPLRMTGQARSRKPRGCSAQPRGQGERSTRTRAAPARRARDACGPSLSMRCLRERSGAWSAWGVAISRL